MKFYLAAPFFNPAQSHLCAQIEDMFKLKGVQLFSPRSQDANRKKELDNEDARQIFRTNVDNVIGCTHMLAVIDWLMPPEMEVRTVKYTLSVNPKDQTQSLQTDFIGGPLNIPDPGTVFEMGMMYGISAVQSWTPYIYGFTMRKPGEKVNIMLTQALAGTIYGLDDLHGFLGRHQQLDLSFAKPGVWRHR